MSEFRIDTVFPGFPGKVDRWGLGWGACYLVRFGTEAMMVDTGGPGMEPWIEKRLNALGVGLQDITKVFLTHIHWDHANNVFYFPNATFYFTETELEFTRRKGDYAAIPFAVPFLEEHKHYVITKEEEEIFENATSILLPGHTPGSCALVLNNNGCITAFTGDAVKNRLDLMTCVASMNPESEQEKANLRKMKELADVIYPGHDGKLSIVDGEVIAEGDNDVSLVMPEGLLINGVRELKMHISMG